MVQNVERPSENQESVVGRILESDILDGCVGYKYPTYGLLSINVLKTIEDLK